LAERLAAQTHAAETAALLNRPTEPVRLSLAAVASDPLNEQAWTVLVTAYELAELPAEGLSAYERCRRIFDRTSAVGRVGRCRLRSLDSCASARSPTWSCRK